MGNNHIAEFLVDLHNLEVHGGVHEHIVIFDGTDVDLGAGEESLDTEHIHDHTALGAGLHITLHHFTALVSGVNHIPRLELTGFLVGDHELTLAVLGALYEHFHLITHLEVGVVTEFRGADNTFALGADVHHHFALVDGGNDTFHNLVLGDLGEGLLILGKGFFLGTLLHTFVLKGIPVKFFGCHRGIEFLNFFRHNFDLKKLVVKQYFLSFCRGTKMRAREKSAQI